jgi:hypothetical protein
MLSHFRRPQFAEAEIGLLPCAVHLPLPELFALLFDGVVAFLDVAADFLRLAAKFRERQAGVASVDANGPRLPPALACCLIRALKVSFDFRIGPDSPHPFPDSSRFVPPLRPV